jgi:hypothetical protein
MEIFVDTAIYSVALVVTLIACFFIWALLVAFYKTYIQKKNPATKVEVKAVSELTPEEKEMLLDAYRADDKNWIQLHVEREGEMLYFYDGDAVSGKFLFQCKTYEDMIENLKTIKGNKGVRINAELVRKLDMADFFLKDESDSQ